MNILEFITLFPSSHLLIDVYNFEEDHWAFVSEYSFCGLASDFAKSDVFYHTKISRFMLNDPCVSCISFNQFENCLNIEIRL